MDSIWRIQAVLHGGRPDRVPVNHRGFSSKAASRILGREVFVGGGIQKWREARSLWEGWHDEFLARSLADAIELAKKTGQDLVRPQYWRQPQKPTARPDEFTFLYEDGKVLQFDTMSEQARYFSLYQKVTTPEDLRAEVDAREKYVVSHIPCEEDFSACIAAQKIVGETAVIEAYAAGLSIPFDDDSAWFTAMLDDPALVEAKLALDVELAKKNIPFLAKRGLKVFLGGNDFASEAGPMYSPKIFDRLFLPKLQEMSCICHGCGGYHFFASDGNLWPVADSLFGKSGIDGYYEVDRKVGMDLERLRTAYPKLTLMGNISSWTMSRGTTQDVRRETISCLEAAREFGGIIVGMSNYVLPEAPPENVDAMLDTIFSYR